MASLTRKSAVELTDRGGFLPQLKDKTLSVDRLLEDLGVMFREASGAKDVISAVRSSRQRALRDALGLGEHEDVMVPELLAPVRRTVQKAVRRQLREDKELLGVPAGEWSRGRRRELSQELAGYSLALGFQSAIESGDLTRDQARELSESLTRRNKWNRRVKFGRWGVEAVLLVGALTIAGTRFGTWVNDCGGFNPKNWFATTDYTFNTAAEKLEDMGFGKQAHILEDVGGNWEGVRREMAGRLHVSVDSLRSDPLNYINPTPQYRFEGNVGARTHLGDNAGLYVPFFDAIMLDGFNFTRSDLIHELTHRAGGFRETYGNKVGGNYYYSDMEEGVCNIVAGEDQEYLRPTTLQTQLLVLAAGLGESSGDAGAEGSLEGMWDRGMSIVGDAYVNARSVEPIRQSVDKLGAGTFDRIVAQPYDGKTIDGSLRSILESLRLLEEKGVSILKVMDYCQKQVFGPDADTSLFPEGKMWAFLRMQMARDIKESGDGTGIVEGLRRLRGEYAGTSFRSLFDLGIADEVELEQRDPNAAATVLRDAWMGDGENHFGKACGIRYLEVECKKASMGEPVDSRRLREDLDRIRGSGLSEQQQEKMIVVGDAVERLR
ncbi:MAG: hypothetical protein ABIH11_07340 [Candidatus Altiarchaeota archaeon]